MNIQEMDPKDLITASWLETYERNIESLWWELVHLNSSIFVLERIFSFPFDLFLPLHRPFWNLVTDALYERCVMIIWRVATDTSGDCLTLRQLKNQIIHNLCKDDYGDQFRRNLSEANFENTVSALEPKIKELRHNYLAHRNRDRNTNPTPDQIENRTFPFSELKVYRDTLYLLWQSLCFGNRRSLLPSEYSSDVHYPVGTDSRSDIEKLLDNIAQDSGRLDLPEENHDEWLIYRESLSEEEFKSYNEYRVKFGLPEVS